MGKKITYEDKIGLKPKGVHKNQVWDDDMIEIKNSVNGLYETNNYFILEDDFDFTSIPIGMDNATWVIRDDFDLGGGTSILPSNVTLNIQGGKLSNGTLTGDNTNILPTNYEVFSNDLTFSGTFNAEYITMRMFGAKGDGITNDFTPIQNSFDFAIQQNIKIKDFGGVYIVGVNPTTNDANDPIYFNYTSADKSFCFEGAGKEITVFKEVDGKVALAESQGSGRFVKMFYLFLNQTFNFESFTFKNCTIDKNGASNGMPPTEFEWEQAHCIGFAETAGSSTIINNILIEDIDFKDKVGAGINLALKNENVNKFIANRITNSDVSGNFGLRGTIEASIFSENIIIQNSNFDYIQIEDMAGREATFDRKKYTKILNSTIDTVEFTTVENGAEFTKLFMECVFVKNKFTFRNVDVEVNNCDVRLTEGVYAKNGFITNSVVRVPYDDIGGSITPIYIWNNVTYNILVTFNSCSFLIDSGDSGITPTGYLFNAESKTSDLTECVVKINNCSTDARLENIVFAYASNTYFVSNSKLRCRGSAFLVGAFSSFTGGLYLEGNDYSEINTGALGYLCEMLGNNALWELEIKEQMKLSEYSVFPNNYNNTEVIYPIKPLLFGTAHPTSGRHYQGEVVYNTLPVAGGYQGWTCVTSGSTGGTWKGFGLIEV